MVLKLLSFLQQWFFRLEWETISLSSSDSSVCLGFSLLYALLRWASSICVSPRKSTLWQVERKELEAGVVVWKEQKSVRQPRRAARSSWYKIQPHPWKHPWVGLGPCYCRLPCGGRRGEREDLAVCRGHIVLWTTRRGDYILSCGNENVGQEIGLATKAEKLYPSVRVGQRDRRITWQHFKAWLNELQWSKETKHGHISDPHFHLGNWSKRSKCVFIWKYKFKHVHSSLNNPNAHQ